jgi:hypothetical protein
MHFRAIVSGLLRAPTCAACALVALWLAGSTAAAQDWMEYAYPDLAFSVAFPAEPKVEMTTYQGADGRAFEARVYSVTRESGVFKLTIVELPDSGIDENALIIHAVNTMTQGSEIKLDIQHRIRQVYGRQLTIKGADGSYSYLAAFLHKKRLYQIEGKAFVAGGYAEVDAMIFHQSLDLT